MGNGGIGLPHGKMSRRLFHLLGGCIPPVLGLVLPRGKLLWFLGIAAGLFLTGEALRLRVERVNRFLMSIFAPASTAFKESESARPIGSTFFVCGAFLTFLLFPRNQAVAALFFGATGDAAAATIGERFGRHKVGRKSLEGSVAFFGGAALAGMVLSRRIPLKAGTIAVGALAAAAAELAPGPLDDNLTVPLVSAAAMSLAERGAAATC